MKTRLLPTLAAILLSAGALHADDSALVLGKATYGALCTNCHGQDGKGGGQVGELFAITPPDLTMLAKANDGKFPFADSYKLIISGMSSPGHGPLEMPVWGDYFMADALEDRGLSKSDAIFVSAGRAFAVALYLESIQE